MPSVYIQSSVFLPTPSGGAGAVELLVSKMAEGLVKRGWKVALFGLEGSTLSAGARVEVGSRGTSEERERTLVETMQRMGEPDVIFDHSLHMFAAQRRGPYVAMSHGMAPLPSWAHNVVFTSEHHGRLHGRKDPQALLLGIDLADIPPSYDVAREGLFWAGRIMPYKRLHLALDIARLAGLPLRIAGPIADEPYARLIWNTFDIHDDDASCGDAAHAHYLGELPRARVLEEMAKTRYFLFTSDETEPAGLVMLEAMACGTQVFAVNQGASLEYMPPEWVAKGAADVVSMIQNDGDPYRSPAQWVAARFTIDHMVDRAEEYLRRAMAGERW